MTDYILLLIAVNGISIFAISAGLGAVVLGYGRKQARREVEWVTKSEAKDEECEAKIEELRRQYELEIAKLNSRIDALEQLLMREHALPKATPTLHQPNTSR